VELAGPDNLLAADGAAGLRADAQAGALSRARRLLARAYAEVPAKSAACVVLECARLEEYAGHAAAARHILRRACLEVGGAHN
jgi:hypothetical protein